MPFDAVLPRPDIVIGEEDRALVHRVLTEVNRDGFSSAAVLLQQELARARVVAAGAVPPSVVTLGTRFLYRDHEGEATRAVTLVAPGHARYGDTNISIMTLLGAALLGLSEGQSIGFRSLAGRIRTVSVLGILARAGEG